MTCSHELEANDKECARAFVYFLFSEGWGGGGREDGGVRGRFGVEARLEGTPAQCHGAPCWKFRFHGGIYTSYIFSPYVKLLTILAVPPVAAVRTVSSPALFSLI